MADNRKALNNGFGVIVCMYVCMYVCAPIQTIFAGFAIMELCIFCCMGIFWLKNQLQL
jgi:hypothetical protein